MGALVTLVAGEAKADSRTIAESFGKRHGDVLRAVGKLIEKRPDVGVRNFAQGSYTLPETGEQEHRHYLMDRDGFTLLVMGFTGDAALDWKLRYIEAFNAMERALVERQAPSPPALFEISEAVKLAQSIGGDEAARIAWEHFGLPRLIEDRPARTTGGERRLMEQVGRGLLRLRIDRFTQDELTAAAVLPVPLTPGAWEEVEKILRLFGMERADFQVGSRTVRAFRASDPH